VEGLQAGTSQWLQQQLPMLQPPLPLSSSLWLLHLLPLMLQVLLPLLQLVLWLQLVLLVLG
jgi:hypothetical protein